VPGVRDGDAGLLGSGTRRAGTAVARQPSVAALHRFALA